MQNFLPYLLIMNALGFGIMLADKRRAIEGRYRIPERTLLAVAVLGGSIGCIFGMYCLRHKTRKPKFRKGLPLIFFMQVCLFFAVVQNLLS